MEFTKENVEKCWEILNKSQNVTEKKQADTFLTNFQKSSNCFEICNELFKSNDINSKIASAFILYQIIRGRVQELSTSKDEFSKLKKISSTTNVLFSVNIDIGWHIDILARLH